MECMVRKDNLIRTGKEEYLTGERNILILWNTRNGEEMYSNMTISPAQVVVVKKTFMLIIKNYSQNIPNSD